MLTVGDWRDDGGGAYSAGAIVPIRNEPNTFAECTLVSQQPVGRADYSVVGIRPNITVTQVLEWGDLAHFSCGRFRT